MAGQVADYAKIAALFFQKFPNYPVLLRALFSRIDI